MPFSLENCVTLVSASRFYSGNSTNNPRPETLILLAIRTVQLVVDRQV